MHKDLKKILVDEKKIEDICLKLASKINQDYKGKKPIIIGVLKGCQPFMSDLLKKLDLDCELDYIVCSSYVGASSSGFVELKKDVQLSVKERDVILIEDIVDTGRTLKMLEEIFKTRHVKSFEVVVLFDKKAARIADFNPKYVGMEIGNDFIVGYGLDYNENYRNLPYVGILKENIY
ncbi:MAG: hypoxanthine phosphoribosyltransferase [Erysipelotrichales bacterium]|nr:hypoxanthine phosphoribosyltransferase [Erysipelotrichales bacterium]